MNKEDHAIKAARVFLENMVAEGLLAKEAGLSVTPKQVVDAGFSQILAALGDSLPLARLMDASDVLFHAEGPGAAHGMPWLSAVSWLMSTVDSNLRKLSAAVFDLWGAEGQTLARHLDLRLPGVVPGSVWIGVKVVVPAADLVPEDADLIERLGAQFATLPTLTRFIDDEGMRPGVEEAFPDPALRDAQMTALYRMSPTGLRGIHTVELSAKQTGVASLSQRERVVLRESIARPDKRLSREGSFVGEVREADLDKTRLHLRNVQGVGTLRCVMPGLSTGEARELLGGWARAEGRYQTDREGRPRLLFVERITPVGQTPLGS